MPTAIELSLFAVDVEHLSDWREDWQRLEQQSADASVYTSYDWVHAWAEVYQPRKLLLARAVNVDDGATAGLGLIAVDRIRGWRFAGGELSPRRAPLCATGCEDQIWKALAGWLRGHPRAWVTLDAGEVGQGAELIPGAHLRGRDTFCLSLPDSLDSYFASLTSKHRSELRRRLRLGEKAGATVRRVPVEDTQAAIDDFLRLHQLRASTKGEHHPTVNVSLKQLLMRISTSDSIDLSLFEICYKGARVAVDVTLTYGDVHYPYNLGWEPAASHLAPGILLAMHGIDEAITRGARMIDLGPGEQPYKLALGFTREPRLMLHATNSSLSARGMQAVGSAFQRLRS